MVARTPQGKEKKKRGPPPLSPTAVRETVKKVERCVARLRELQSTVAVTNKPPKSSCPEEEWRDLSLPAMLLGETVSEIKAASGFARKIDAAGEAMKAKRMREKACAVRSPPARSARARITFRPAGPEPGAFVRPGSPAVFKGPKHRFMVKSPAAAAGGATRVRAAVPAKARRSFSPARMAARLVSMSPLRTRSSSSKRETAPSATL